MASEEQRQKSSRSSSLLLQLAALVILVALILQAISVGTDYWVARKEGREIRWHAGLWVYVLRQNIPPRGIVPAVYPVLSLVSMLLLILTFIVNIVYLWKRIYLMLPTMIVFSAIADVLTLIVISMWANPHRELRLKLHWSFAMACLTLIFTFIAAILYLVATLDIRRNKQPRDHALVVPSRQPQYVYTMETQITD